MRLLILGCGYVGTRVMVEWGDLKPLFVATTTTANKLPTYQTKAEKAYLIRGDDPHLKNLLLDCDGAIICVAPSQPDAYKSTYLQTAENIKSILTDWDKPFYLLYTSSTSVYGNHGGKWVKETSECLNLTPKAQILKHTEETYLSIDNSKVDVAILRLAGIYGPGRSLEERMYRLAGKPISGYENDPTNHIHVNDIVGAIQLCFKKRLKGIFNLASDDHPLKKELYSTLCHNLQIDVPKFSHREETRHGSNCLVSNQKIKEQGFLFQHPFIWEKEFSSKV